jgi:hypothetical protein
VTADASPALSDASRVAVTPLADVAMSVVDHREVKLVLPRSGLDPLWQRLLDDYAGDPIRSKYLAMLALRENSGWPLEAIARIFEHPKGHVSRVIKTIKAEIRERYQLRDDTVVPIAPAEASPEERAAA